MLFISQTLPYSFCACVRNTPKFVTFVVGKMKMVSFSLFLDAFPLNTRRPLDNDMSLLRYTTYVKGILGLGGKASKNKLKYTNLFFLMTNDTILGVFRTHFARLSLTF